MKIYNTYEQEQNKLLKDFLLRKEKDAPSVEFIISSVCNQSCEYCYLFKHGREMYPPEANNPKNILENFPILIDWLEENKFNFKTYDIFSGEFFNLPYWEDIIEMIYDHEKERQEKNPEVEHRNISIPTNCSFLMNDEKTKRIESWIDKYRKIGMDFYISLSVEGPKELEALERPLNNKQVKDENNFYTKFLDFRKRYHLSAHPMITKNFVKDYKTNYDWWIDTTIENKIMQLNTQGEEVYSVPMFLEVRDAEQWDTPEALENYKKFLNYVADKDFKSLHESNLDDFAYHFFDDFLDVGPGKLVYGKYTHMQPYIIGFPYLLNKIPCSIQGGAVFRVGDLAYVPCHRTCYPHFVYGKFIKENGKIVELEAQRPALAIKIKNLNPNRQVLKCTGCPIQTFCLKGCLGSQYEHTNELFCAEETVCDMFYVKYKTIHEIALRYDLYDWLDSQYTISTNRKEFVNYGRKIIESI